MTTPSATTMSERLLDLSDIIRPIAIEETRRYLDSKDLVTKADLNERLKSTERYLETKIDGIQTKLMLQFILAMVVLLSLAVGAIGVMISAKTITATTNAVQTAMPFTQIS